MQTRIIKICILLAFLPLLSSCWDANEPNRMRYIYGIGVDYKDGKYELYTQILDFVNIAKTESPQQDALQVEVTKGSGHTIEEAIFDVYHSIDLKIFWGHMTYMVFSEEVLKEGRADEVINAFIRNRDTRYQAWIYATSDPVEDILLLNPLFNNAMTRLRLVDPMSSYKQESFIEPINLRKLIIDLNEPSHEVNIPYITMKDWKTEKGEDQLPEVAGVATINSKELKGIIKDDKVRGLQWMTKETIRGEVSHKREEEGNYIAAMVDNLKIKVKPIDGEGQVYFDVKLNMNVLLGSFEGKISADDVKKNVKEQLKKEIEETFKESLKHDIDIYRLSEYVYRHELDMWKKYQKDGKVELTEDSIRSLTIEINKVYSGRKKFKDTIE